MLAQALKEIEKTVAIRPRYENFIGGKWVAPVKGQYFENINPITGKKVCDIARSTVLMELIADILPPGVVTIVNGFGIEAGKPLAQHKRIAKIAFTGETTTGRLIMQYASENIIPVTLELGGKSPNIFFADVMAENEDLVDKAL